MPQEGSSQEAAAVPSGEEGEERDRRLCSESVLELTQTRFAGTLLCLALVLTWHVVSAHCCWFSYTTAAPGSLNLW